LSINLKLQQPIMSALYMVMSGILVHGAAVGYDVAYLKWTISAKMHVCPIYQCTSCQTNTQVLTYFFQGVSVDVDPSPSLLFHNVT